VTEKTENNQIENMVTIRAFCLSWATENTSLGEIWHITIDHGCTTA